MTMTPKTDSVAVLREKHIADLQFLRNDCGPDEPYAAALDAAIAALEAQGESKPIGYMDPAAEFLLPKPDGCVLSSHIDLLLVRDPYGRFTQPLYLHPAPPGSDAVTEEEVDAAIRRYRELEPTDPVEPDETTRAFMRELLEAALASRTGKGEA